MNRISHKLSSISMHEGIAVWCDCCSCEAEPYWLEVAEELGIDPGSDYQDGERQLPAVTHSSTKNKTPD